MASSRSLFFDLDGTLTDPKPGITGCIQYALERLDEPVPDRDALEWCIGPPLLQNFTTLVGTDRAPKAVELYRERFADVGLFENDVYDGIPETLEALRGAGNRLFVASSKPRVYVERILEHFRLMHHVEIAFGSELDGTRSDKRELLAWATDQVRVAPAESTMIGDRGLDARGAFHNGLAFVGVLYGYGSETELRDAGAERFASTPPALPSVLGR